MPLYGSQTVVSVIPGDLPLTLFNAETPQTGQSSIAFSVMPKPHGSPVALSFEFTFAANPGAFEFDIQDADTEFEDNYLLVPAVGQVQASQGPQKNGKFVARVELSPTRGTFFRVFTALQNANAVASTVKVTAS